MDWSYLAYDLPFFFFKHTIEGTIEGVAVTGRQERRRKQLLDDLKSKKDALGCALWRTGFGSGYGSVVRQST